MLFLLTLLSLPSAEAATAQVMGITWEVSRNQCLDGFVFDQHERVWADNGTVRANAKEMGLVVASLSLLEIDFAAIDAHLLADGYMNLFSEETPNSFAYGYLSGSGSLATINAQINSRSACST